MFNIKEWNQFEPAVMKSNVNKDYIFKGWKIADSISIFMNLILTDSMLYHCMYWISQNQVIFEEAQIFITFSGGLSNNIPIHH